VAYEQSIHTLLNEVIRRNASDLHLGVGIPPALRIDGDLHYIGGPVNLTNEDIRRMVTEVLTRQKLAQFEEEWELDFSFTFKIPGGDSARFRGNCFFERGSLAAAFRMIPTQVRSFKQLMLPKSLEDMAGKQRGIFLVTGPTGSGKSTTLAALMQQINTTRRCHVSPSRTRSSTSSSPKKPSSSSEKWGSTPVPFPTRSNGSCGRTPTSS